MGTLEEWMATVRAELALDGDGVADLRVVQDSILDLARDAAHGVARPAAPLTAYLVGVAVGRGASLPEAAGRIAALALSRLDAGTEGSAGEAKAREGKAGGDKAGEGKTGEGQASDGAPVDH
ncbi:MAG TPA: DUF6457 domain-containing protein [Trebonia sp.]|jgi:hypothetical protein|nr:DUF6457 domain-containing protein [Trebonia sp.]